jgi:hypothetical protein
VFEVPVSKVQRFWVQGFKGYGLDATAFDRLRPRTRREELVTGGLLSSVLRHRIGFSLLSINL